MQIKLRPNLQLNSKSLFSSNDEKSEQTDNSSIETLHSIVDSKKRINSTTSKMDVIQPHHYYLSRKKLYTQTPTSPTLSPYTTTFPTSPSLVSDKSSSIEVGISIDQEIPSRFCFSPVKLSSDPLNSQDLCMNSNAPMDRLRKRLSNLTGKFTSHIPSPTISGRASRRPSEPLGILQQLSDSPLTREYSGAYAELGRGVSGAVMLVERHKDRKLVAAKLYTFTSSNGKKVSVAKQLKRVGWEIMMLSKLHHENVIQTLDLVNHNQRIMVVMEYCPTNMFYLVKNKRLSPELQTKYFTQLGAGVAYLHNEVGIAHRDLKLENLCVSSDGQLKIVDFGSAVQFATTFPWRRENHSGASDYAKRARVSISAIGDSDEIRSRFKASTGATFRKSVDHGSFSRGHAVADRFELLNNGSKTKFQLTDLRVRGLCGSDPYIAPEVWTSNDPLHPHYNRGYDPRLADIWSMGIILAAIHTGRFPWASTRESDHDYSRYAYSPILYLNQFDIPKDKFILVSHLLETDVNYRPLIDKVMDYLL